MLFSREGFILLNVLSSRLMLKAHAFVMQSTWITCGTDKMPGLLLQRNKIFIKEGI